MMISNDLKGLLLAILGTICFASKVIFVKLAYGYEVDSTALLLLRMLFALPFYLIVLTIFRKRLNYGLIRQRSILLPLIVTALLGYYISSWLDFKGLQYIDASIERLILYVFPSFVVLLSWPFFKKKPSLKIVLSLLICYLGLVIVFSPYLGDFGKQGPEFWKGVSYIFCCAITFAMFYIGNQLLIPKVGALVFTNLSMTIACLAVIVHYLLTGTNSSLLEFHPWVYIYAILMAFVSTVIPSYMISYSIHFIGASRSSIISSFGPVATIVLAYVFLGERMTAIQLLGGGIVISSIIFMKRGTQKLP